MWITIANHVRAVVFASVGMALGCATGAFGGAVMGSVLLYRAAYGESMDAILQMTNRGVNIKWGPNIGDDDDEEENYYVFRDLGEDSETDTDTDTDEEIDDEETSTDEDSEEDEETEEDDDTEPKSKAPSPSLRDAVRTMPMYHLRQRRTTIL